MHICLLHARSDAFLSHVNTLRVRTTHLISSSRARYNPIPELFTSLFHISSTLIIFYHATQDNPLEMTAPSIRFWCDRSHDLSRRPSPRIRVLMCDLRAFGISRPQFHEGAGDGTPKHEYQPCRDPAHDPLDGVGAGYSACSLIWLTSSRICR
jgi:hypothetical protein